MLSGFIEDGQEDDAYIDGVDRVYLPLRFKMRPMGRRDTNAHSAATKDKPDDVYDQITNEWLARKIISWDLKTRKGTLVPITAENMGRLKQALHTRLVAVVWGYQPSDVDPQWTDEQREAYGMTVREAAAAGVTVGQLEEAKAEKNYV